ncbi:hypothetical protein [Flexivirga oryzae]|uniref:Uncharacterized protein n=1 Tax=Flexivirga oryzae TaxID=1794944 RepID=A0A839NH57_9MICO|nr:hypothetical protein [Flexivirga oryzae]MBB2894001.1 hypothetical protein [Flexivirga oryzae]
MPTRPLPPEALDELVEAYGATAQAVLDLGLTCRPDDFERPTQHEGRTVLDQIARVAGLPSGGQRTGHDVVQELAHVLPRRLRALRDPELTLDSPTPGIVGGAGSLGSTLHRQIIDTWCLEQDLREALDRPGNLDSAAAAMVVTAVLTDFPAQAAGAGLEPGTSVIIECTGPVLAREGVRITPTSDGSLRGEALFSGRAHVDETDDTTGEVIIVPPGSITTIRLTTEALTRRGAGRVPTADLRYSVVGDEGVAARVLDRLAIVS